MSTSYSNPSADRPNELTARWTELAERILVCGRLFRDHLTRQAGRWQLSEPEFSLLWACRNAPRVGLGQKELASSLAVSPSAVSGLVEQLRRGGLVEGHRAADDRRRQLWRLTQAGQTRLRAVLDDLAAWATHLDDRLTAPDSKELIRLLERLVGLVRTGSGGGSEADPAGRPPLRKFDPQAVHHSQHREGAA